MQKAEKELLYKQLRERDGHMLCHYCQIQEDDFSKLWGRFYGLGKRGRMLEIEHKEAVVNDNGRIRKVKKIDLKHTPENCVLACALCNMAKSNMFTYDEFKRVGKVIEEIWQQRKNSGLEVEQDC